MMIPDSIRPVLQLSALVLPFLLGCGSSAAPSHQESHASHAEMTSADHEQVGAVHREPPGEEEAAQHGREDHGHGAPAEEGQATHEADAQPVDLAAAEQAAYAEARPVFGKYCAACHTTDGAKSKKATLTHFNMDQYPFGGHHAEEIGASIRQSLGATGKEATMPLDDPGAVEGKELALILAWADAFERAHAAGLHEHEGHHGHEETHEH